MIKRSRTEYSMINMMVGFAGYFVNSIIGFVCRMVFVRSLPEAYLGINGLFGNILSMLSLAELGIGTAIVYALYRPFAENDEDKVASLMQFYGKAYRVIGCVIGIIGVVLLPGLKYLIKETPDIKENIYLIYLVFLFNTCFSYFFSYRASLLVAAQRNYIQTGLSYIINTLQSVIQIILLLATHNYLLYLAVQIVGSIAFCILISKKVKRDYPYIDKKETKPLALAEKRTLFKNVKALTVNRLAEILVDGTDNIIIAYFNGLIAVGSASNYTLLMNTLATLAGNFFNGMVGSVGNLNAIESDERRYSFFKVLQMGNFWIFSWAALGLTFVSGDIVGFFFGEKFVLPLAIPFSIALNYYIVSMQMSVTTYRSTMGLFRYGQYTLIFTSALNLIFSIWLGKIWGLFGIYFATTIARVLTNHWYIPYAVFKYGLKRNPLDYFKRYILYGVVVFFEGGICYFLCGLCHFGFGINIIIKVIICTIVPNTVFCICFCRTTEFKELKSKVMQVLMRASKHVE